MKVFNCILGVLSIFAAIYCFILPLGSFWMTTGWMVAVLLGVIGICCIFEYAHGKKNKTLMLNGPVVLIMGIGAAVLSTLAIINPRWQNLFNVIIVLLFSVWMVISGIESISQAFSLKKNNKKFWWVSLILGIFVIIGGIYGGTHILITGAFLGYILGIAMMMYGIRLICSVFEKSEQGDFDI
ncbi:MAG: DUF308 domain-containing protein [Ruminococcus sp.]|nr:DUF308 domain-containing protein [Ruminococcus sp.]